MLARILGCVVATVWGDDLAREFDEVVLRMSPLASCVVLGRPGQGPAMTGRARRRRTRWKRGRWMTYGKLADLGVVDTQPLLLLRRT